MNKRLHQLERIIRYEYNCFITACYPKDKALILLRNISDLLRFKVWYLYDTGRISEDERHFMLKCNNCYMDYANNILNYY